MIGKWVTIREATQLFHVARSTINRWRATYPIREVQIPNDPVRLHFDDLAAADGEATTNNPVIR